MTQLSPWFTSVCPLYDWRSICGSRWVSCHWQPSYRLTQDERRMQITQCLVWLTAMNEERRGKMAWGLQCCIEYIITIKMMLSRERRGFSDYHQLDCLFSSFWHASNKEASKLHVNGLWRVEFIRDQEWGLLSQYPPFHYFPHFSAFWKHTLAIKYHVYIWQVSPQVSCSHTC